MVANPEDPVRTPLSPIRVRANSPVDGIAGLLTSSIVEDRCITLRAIGAGAVNQAVKGTIKARQTLAGSGEDLYLIPGFTTIEGDNGDDVSAIILRCLLKDW